MTNNLKKYLWLAVAVASAFAAGYFGHLAIYAVTAIAVYFFMQIEMIECAVVGCMAAMDAYTQQPVEDADERMIAESMQQERAALSSESFARRIRDMNEFDS